MCGLVFVLVPRCAVAQVTDDAQRPTVTLTPQDRILILAPHPDDEVLCCGGLIQSAVAKGLPVRVVFFTYGDNNEWSFIVYRKHPVLMPREVQSMGLVRHDEAVAAAKTLGLSPDQLTFLGYPDFGTMAIWKAHWGNQRPFRSMLTRVTAVPYANAARPGAPYKGDEVLKDLTAVLRTFRPTKLFVSHPGDHMPDHSALYLFTRVALWDVEADVTPEVYPYPVHFESWPKPRGYHPDTPLVPPTAFASQTSWQAYQLAVKEIPRKRAALEAHRTQVGYSANYLLAFVRPNELFGDFPVVPLTASSADELTEEQRKTFVGLEVHLEGRTLALSIASSSQSLVNPVETSVYIFGYRTGEPFASMPKLHVKCGMLGCQSYNQGHKLPQDTLQSSRQEQWLTLRIPLAVLGNPEYLFTSARTYLGSVPLDRISWRILELPTQRQSSEPNGSRQVASRFSPGASAR